MVCYGRTGTASFNLKGPTQLTNQVWWEGKLLVKGRDAKYELPDGKVHSVGIASKVVPFIKRVD